jgi:hypothetical protein
MLWGALRVNPQVVPHPRATSNFGQVTATPDPRILQVGGKFN